MNQNIRIFIGDRPSLHLNSVQRALTLQGHACHFAHDFAEAASVTGQDAWDIALINPGVFAADTFALCRALRAADALNSLEIAFLESDDHDPAQWAAHALTAIQGCVRIRRSRQELREQAAASTAAGQIDPLTGLCSAERWHRIATAEAAQASGNRAPLSTLSIRLKNADAILDAGGPSSLECALQQMAAVFHAGTRGVDFLARGGERGFYLLAPHTDESQIARVAHRLRDAALQHPLIAAEAVFTLETACGISSLAPGETDESGMVARALQAQEAQCCKAPTPQQTAGGAASRAA